MIKEESHEDFINFEVNDYEDFNFKRNPNQEPEFDYNHFSNNIANSNFFDSVDFFL